MNPIPTLENDAKKTTEGLALTKPLPAGEIASDFSKQDRSEGSPTNLETTRTERLLAGLKVWRESGAKRNPGISKGTYSRAVRAFCLECCGHNPFSRDCGGADLFLDGPCRLFAINTVKKRKATLKSKIRKIIVEECRFCMQSRDICGCASLNCSLYPFGPGRKKATTERLPVGPAEGIQTTQPAGNHCYKEDNID